MTQPIDTLIFLGINGVVFALDRTTGTEVWCVELKGSDFVNVVLDGDRVLATTKGEIYCIDPVTAQVIWQNDLPGMGTGIVSIATVNAPSNPDFVLAQEKHRRDQQTAAATTAAAIGLIQRS
jgi:outer membrane protein assembly factor BamB